MRARRSSCRFAVAAAAASAELTSGFVVMLDDKRSAGISGGESNSSTSLARGRERDMDIRVRSARERMWRGLAGEGEVAGVDGCNCVVRSGEGGEGWMGGEGVREGGGRDEFVDTIRGAGGEGGSEGIGEVSLVEEDGWGGGEAGRYVGMMRDRRWGTGVACSAG